MEEAVDFLAAEEAEDVLAAVFFLAEVEFLAEFLAEVTEADLAEEEADDLAEEEADDFEEDDLAEEEADDFARGDSVHDLAVLLFLRFAGLLHLEGLFLLDADFSADFWKHKIAG